jgi:hypothetical protein
MTLTLMGIGARVVPMDPSSVTRRGGPRPVHAAGSTSPVAALSSEDLSGSLSPSGDGLPSETPAVGTGTGVTSPSASSMGPGRPPISSRLPHDQSVAAGGSFGAADADESDGAVPDEGPVATGVPVTSDSAKSAPGSTAAPSIREEPTTGTMKPPPSATEPVATGKSCAGDPSTPGNCDVRSVSPAHH